MHQQCCGYRGAHYHLLNSSPDFLAESVAHLHAGRLHYSQCLSTCKQSQCEQRNTSNTGQEDMQGSHCCHQYSDRRGTFGIQLVYKAQYVLTFHCPSILDERTKGDTFPCPLKGISLLLFSHFHSLTKLNRNDNFLLT